MRGTILAGYDAINQPLTAIVSVWNEIEMELVWWDYSPGHKLVPIAQRTNDIGWHPDKLQKATHSYIFVEKE